MGWSHAPRISTLILTNLAVRAGLAGRLLGETGRHRVIGDCVVLIYIDDMLFFGLVLSTVLEAMLQLERICRLYKLPWKPSKTVFPQIGAGEMIGLGLSFDAWGNILPAADKLNCLLHATWALLQDPTYVVPKRELQRLLGNWTWFLLLRREGFSVLYHVYQQVAKGGGILSGECRKEIFSLISLARVNPSL